APVTGEPDLIADGDRITYTHQILIGRNSALSTQHSALAAWYVNRADGLEQGFTIHQAPAPQSAGRWLRIALAVSGELQPAMSDDARAIEFQSADGATNLRYGDLMAFDATGRELPARMQLDADRIDLDVDDTGAVYPVTIDPNWTQQQKLIASDG